MATLLLTATSICGGGNHITVNVQLNGVDKGTHEVYADDILADFNEAEIAGFIKTVIRAHKIGKTNGQVKDNLQAGLTVTL